jgi:toxin CptA
MMDMLSPPWFALAILLVGTMGFAIQRGATCMVAAVDEILTRRRASRAAAMGEAGLWVGGLLGLALLLGAPVAVPSPVPVLLPTLAGAVLLGLGAHINRACVFGAIARLGSGDWAYLFTPIGLMAGYLLVYRLDGLLPLPMPAAAAPSPVWALVMTALLAVLVCRRLMLLKGPHAAGGSLARRVGRDIASPRGATSVIGIGFAILLLFAGPWTYPEVLATAAHDGMAPQVAQRAALFLALLAGAMLGGWSGGRVFLAVPSPAHCLRCLAGGATMAAGSLLVPGSNDGLLLLGLPLLQAYAVVALLVMCGTIAIAQSLALRSARHRAERA